MEQFLNHHSKYMYISERRESLATINESPYLFGGSDLCPALLGCWLSLKVARFLPGGPLTVVVNVVDPTISRHVGLPARGKPLTL